MPVGNTKMDERQDSDDSEDESSDDDDDTTTPTTPQAGTTPTNAGDDDDDSSEDDDEQAAADDDDGDDENQATEKAEAKETDEPTTPVRPSNIMNEAFIRNIPFEATEEAVKELFEQFGAVSYALINMDKITGRPRGSAFVRFIDESSLAKCLAHPSDELSLNGRALNVSQALPKEQVQAIAEQQAEQSKPKDKRNIYLLDSSRVGSDVPISDNDRRKRQALETRANDLLKSNLHLFVSPNRLSIHNLPKSWSDETLRMHLGHAVNDKSAKVLESRIMRDMARLDADGQAKSKGYAFVAYEKAEHAEKALMMLNNNPFIIQRDRRPIVQYSLENRVALAKKEKRLANSKKKNAQLGEIRSKIKLGLPTSDQETRLLGKKKAKLSVEE